MLLSLLFHWGTKLVWNILHSHWEHSKRPSNEILKSLVWIARLFQWHLYTLYLGLYENVSSYTYKFNMFVCLDFLSLHIPALLLHYSELRGWICFIVWCCLQFNARKQVFVKTVGSALMIPHIISSSNSK